jgi:hypothetical protein
MRERMPKVRKSVTMLSKTTANLDFEAERWDAANPQGSMGTAEYKHNVLGCTFFNADFILTSPSSNVSDRHGELVREDQRWAYSALQLQTSREHIGV